MKKYNVVALSALLVCGACYAAQDTTLTQHEVRDPRQLETYLESNASDAESRLSSAEAGTNVSLANTYMFIGNSAGKAAAATPAATRTNLSLVIGSNVQAYDADLDTWATVTPSANGKTFVALANYAAMRTNLNLVIGTDVQAYDADLDMYAGITPSANIQTLLGSATFAEARTNLSLVPGINVQAYDADLDTYAGITPSANVQTLLGSATFAEARTNLGLVIGTDVLAYDANTAARAATAGKSCTNTWVSGPTDTITNVQIFVNGLLTSWTTNGVEIP